jgi:hypothetical protein
MQMQHENKSGREETPNKLKNNHTSNKNPMHNFMEILNCRKQKHNE